ncbi:hypothetical protein BURKHO8Y_150015 [Burkholderia sp. 8Y]|nr:hypothetical protein BURKHO8Y_150015 [Burkholderia sp. 8Y]
MEGPSKVARLAGFEPTTPWFVAKYSIQLSYSRTQNGTTTILPGDFNALLVKRLVLRFEAEHRNKWRGWQDSNPRPLGS